jgi:hypothetical protein
MVRGRTYRVRVVVGDLARWLRDEEARLARHWLDKQEAPHIIQSEKG